MSHLNLKKIIKILKDFAHEKKTFLEVLLVGGLALHHYGMRDRATVDVDAEVKGDITSIVTETIQR